MIRLGSLLAFSAGLVLLSIGCSKDEEDCAFLAPSIVYVGFDENESDTMIIRRFENNNQFDNLLDTFVVSKANITRTIVGTDSVILSPANYPALNNEFYSNNWELYLPGAQETVRIDNITPRFNSQTETGAQCQSYVEAVHFNGSPYTYDSWFGDEYRVYITN
jgi:hypothetical protein